MALKDSSKVKNGEKQAQGKSGGMSATDVSGRHRKALLILAFLVLLIVLSAAVWLLLLIPGQLTVGNPRFNLKNVYVPGVGYWHNRGDELLSRLKIKKGTNLFDLNAGEIRKKLLELPNVENAEVQLVLPDMIVFNINERVPRAAIDRIAVIDEHGVIFKRSESLAADHRKLPQIVMRSGGRKSLQQEAVALIMTANRECKDIEIDRIILDNPSFMTVELTYRNDRQWVVKFPFTPDEFGSLFNKLQNAILHCALNRENPIGFDLRFKEYAIPLYQR